MIIMNCYMNAQDKRLIINDNVVYHTLNALELINMEDFKIPA